MFDGQKATAVPPDHAEYQVLVHDEFPKRVPTADASPQPPHERSRFGGSNGMSKKDAAGLRKPAQGRHDVIEETVEEAGQRGGRFWTENDLDGGQVGREVIGEDRPPTGHVLMGVRVFPALRSSRPRTASCRSMR